MKLERSLFQNSYLYFVVFFLFVIVAFWLTYFTKIFDQESYRMHTHGVTLILWCVMLIVQPLLIRLKRNKLHRSIGKFSYLLVPLLVFTTLDLLKFRVGGNSQLGTMDHFFIALVVNALIAFLILYGRAIYYRKNSSLHSRYMVCTIFPFFTPVTDRIIHIHLPSILPYLYTIEGTPQAPVVGFLLADLILVALIIWDYRSHRRWKEFSFALLILLLYHYSVLNFYKFQFWKSFGVWFAGV